LCYPATFFTGTATISEKIRCKKINYKSCIILPVLQKKLWRWSPEKRSPRAQRPKITEASCL
jgi:hypothetical protein